MIKFSSFLLIFIVFANTTFAARTQRSLEVPLNSYSSGLKYFDNPEQHRLQFFEWFSKHKSQDSFYHRVVLTVSCRDCDYIPKCENSGKTFYERGSSYQLMHNGVKIIKDCYYGEWMTNLIYGLKGHHEPQEEKVFYEVLKHIPRKGVMIELGSYWGYYSLWFAKTIPDSTNYLIEPDSERMKIGKKNFSLNGLNAKFIQGYVGACNDNSADFRQASQLFIDSFLENNGIEHVDILHSDIQGSEFQMLQSAIGSIQSKKIDYFFISTHSDNIHHDCIHFLRSYDYVIIAEHSPSESYSADGLVVGKRADLSGLQPILISKHSNQ